MSRIDDAVASAVRESGLASASGSPGGAIGVVVDGRVEHASYHGLANVEFDVPWRRSTRYRLASITKTLTAQAVLAAADRGLVAVEQEAHELLDVLGPSHRGITIAHLLTMSSGIPYDEDLCELVGVRGRIRADFLVGLAARQPLQFAPGTDQVYACSNYRLLAMVLGRVVGGTWEDAVRRLVLTPLGLDMTFGGFYDELEHDEATAYRPPLASDAPGAGRRRHGNSFECTGDGGLKATLEQLLHWCAASSSDPGSVPSWHRLFDVPDPPATGWYRYGLCTGSIDGTPTWFHGGASNTFYLHLPDRGLTVACLVNAMEVPARSLASAIARSLVTTSAGAPPRRSTTATSAARVAAGEYVDPSSGLRIAIAADGRAASVLTAPATVEDGGDPAAPGCTVSTRSRQIVVDGPLGDGGALRARLGAEEVRVVPVAAEAGAAAESSGLAGWYDAPTLPGSIRIACRGDRLVLVRGAGGDDAVDEELRWLAADVAAAGPVGIVVERTCAGGAVTALLLSTLATRRVRFVRRVAAGQ